MDELDKLYNDEYLPSGKRKKQILEIADSIIAQIMKTTPELLDAQIVAEIVSIGIRDIIDTGMMDKKVDGRILLTNEQKDKLLGDGWTWGKYYYDSYFR